MGIPLIATIEPQNNGLFATHDAQYGKGGWVSVPTVVEMGNISPNRRTAGMACRVVSLNVTYILNSDLLTWTPTTAAPVIGSSTTIATINLAGSGNLTLLPAQYNSNVIVLSGLLTSNVLITVPPTPNVFVLANQTTGPYSVTFTTGFGTNIAVTQGTQSDIFSNGQDIKLSSSDFSNVTLGANTVAVTLPLTDSSNAVATTAFVKNQGYITAAQASPVRSVFGRIGDVILQPTDVIPLIPPTDGGTF